PRGLWIVQPGPYLAPHGCEFRPVTRVTFEDMDALKPWESSAGFRKAKWWWRAVDFDTICHLTPAKQAYFRGCFDLGVIPLEVLAAARAPTPPRAPRRCPEPSLHYDFLVKPDERYALFLLAEGSMTRWDERPAQARPADDGMELWSATESWQ